MDYLGLQKKYSKLPDSLKKAIFSVENAEKIQDIAKKYHLQREKMSCMARETGLVILGEVHYNDFQKALQESCGLIPESAQAIINDIAREILAPIADELKKVHGYEIPKHLINSPKPIPKTPASLGIAEESFAPLRSAQDDVVKKWTAQDLKQAIEKNNILKYLQPQPQQPQPQPFPSRKAPAPPNLPKPPMPSQINPRVQGNVVDLKNHN